MTVTLYKLLNKAPNTYRDLKAIEAMNSHLASKYIGHWNRLPRDMVIPPVLTELKKHLDNALSDVTLGDVLHEARSWTR